jgi:hypothetical protein
MAKHLRHDNEDENKALDDLCSGKYEIRKEFLDPSW